MCRFHGLCSGFDDLNRPRGQVELKALDRFAVSALRRIGLGLHSRIIADKNVQRFIRHRSLATERHRRRAAHVFEVGLAARQCLIPPALSGVLTGVVPAELASELGLAWMAPFESVEPVSVDVSDHEVNWQLFGSLDTDGKASHLVTATEPERARVSQRRAAHSRSNTFAAARWNASLPRAGRVAF